MIQKPNIAVVGATGAVGREMINLLEERRFPCASVRLLASSRSAGTTIDFDNRRLNVEELSEGGFEGVDIALFSAGAGVSREYAPRAVESGATVVDNSSAFRMDNRYPLVVPEINPDQIRARTIIANPNCSTIIMLMAVSALRAMFGVERICVSTYQAVSGAGAAAMRELEQQSRDVLAGQEPKPRIFREVCAFNVFSHDSAIGEDGYNVEERKMADEAHKIWDDPDVAITATCVRVPVFRTHCESINVTLKQEIGPDDLGEIRQAISQFPGVSVVDDREANRFPTPRLASGHDDVLVGRIRLDRSQMRENGRSRGIEMFIAGDQIRKGAALNAIQIAEHLLHETS